MTAEEVFDCKVCSVDWPIHEKVTVVLFKIENKQFAVYSYNRFQRPNQFKVCIHNITSNFLKLMSLS